MSIYFIVVCYNNRDLLEECLKSIQSQTVKNSVILVDNGSSDGSADYVKKYFPDVILIEQDKNLGFAIANNIGIDEALKDPECTYVALLNSDATVDKNWSETIMKFAVKHPKAASIQTYTVDYYDHKVLDSRGITIDTYGRARQLGHREAFDAKRGPELVFGVNAAACVYSRDFLAKQPFSDYFDADLWMYLEDVDIAARATILGWENWCIDGSKAYHMGSASSSKNPGFSVFHIYRNNYLMLLKNLPVSSLLVATFGAMATDIVTILKLARHKNIVPIKAIIRGRFAALKLIPLFIKKRQKVMRGRKISPASLKELVKAS